MTSQKLNLSLKQSLNLTFSLRQSISILQMSHVELSELLEKELDKNPFLQSNDFSNEQTEERSGYDYLSINNQNENYDPFATIKDTKSSIEQILEQIGEVVINQAERIIAIYLANLLQENGYIKLDLDVAENSLKCSKDTILKVLEKLQTLEPTGIFARNLQECLSLQLKEKGIYNALYEQILHNLNLIANHDFVKLAKICNTTSQYLIDHIQNIKSLTPKPISFSGSDYATSRIADVIIYIDDDQNIIVRLNEEALSKISVNKTYYSSIKNENMKTADKDFISQEYYAANNLVRAISQRSKTVLAVANAIVEKQKNFFLKGVMYFEPMTLSDVATICALNESTISRATNGKYMQTPTGIYEMKFFFSSHIVAKNSDSQISSTKIKEIIKTIIDSEEQSNILSDDNIVEELSKFNINIARRTVAKYREALGIATSSTRKRMIKNYMSA